MFASGDYISPRLCGCLWFEKPVLLYWTEAGAYHLFGVSEFSARLPAAMFALATVLLMFFGLTRFISRAAAAMVALVLGTMAIFVVYARAATTDMILAATMSLALLSGYRAASDGQRLKLSQWSVCAGAVGLALLAKGLVGPVLVGLILGAYLIATGRLGLLRWRYIVMAAAIVIVVAGVWYVPVTARHGWDFLDRFFLQHHFQRYTSNRYNHPQPFYFFFLVAIAGAAPWSFFLIPAAQNLPKLRPRENVRDSLVLLAWLWAGVPLIFFSFSQSKLPGYLLPAFPGLAIIVGCQVERAWKGDRGITARAAEWLTPLLLIVLGIAFVLYLSRTHAEVAGWRVGLAWLPVVMGLMLTIALLVGRRRVLVPGTAAAVAALVVAALVLLFPVLNDTKSLKGLSLRAAGALRPGEKIAFFLMKEYAPVFYTEGQVACRPGMGSVVNAMNTGALAGILEQEQSLMVFTTTDWISALEGDPLLELEPVAAEGKARVIRVRLREGAPSL